MNATPDHRPAGSPIRIAVVGCGAIAQAGHLPALLAHPRFEVRGLCDCRPDRLEAALGLCRQLSPDPVSAIRQDADYKSVIDAGDIDAVLLALHPEHSVAIAIDVLARGIPVLDEKPLAVTAEDGTRLKAAVRAADTPYQAGFVFRYARLFQDAAGWCRALDSPRCYHVGIYDERPSQHVGDNQRMIQELLRTSSAITHEGSHVIDWMGSFTSATISSVKASAVKTRPAHQGPNVWLANFDYEDGSTLQLAIGWLLENQPASTLRVIGDRGRLKLDLFSGVGELDVGATTELVTTEPLRQPWSIQLDHFATAVDTGRVTGATVDDGLRALHATIACERSFANDTVIHLNEGRLA